MNKLFIKLGEGLYQKMDKAKDLTKLIKKKVVDKNGHSKTVWVKPEQTVKVRMRSYANDLFNNYFAMGFSERVGEIKKTSDIALKKCREFETLIDNKPEEHCGAFNSEGKLLLYKKDKYDEIEFNKIEIDKIRKAEIITHNHPEDRSFSKEDVFLILSTGIKEIRIISPNYIYSLKISSKSSSLNKQDLFNKYNRLFEIIDKIDNTVKINSLFSIKNNKELDKNLSLKNAEINHNDKLVENIINNYDLNLYLNIKYKKNERFINE